ncbi:hypothetical protein DERF_002651 [Dermatophagoides farinae]|uniref:Uncharacterized protein n=1 Tax=Dermatophagoides farinae TaxID=6954 RepID=A0A922IDB5_DERFA|nr:hypothetical protein DERF_002651 [Dermatophagoides farinae]
MKSYSLLLLFVRFESHRILRSSKGILFVSICVILMFMCNSGSSRSSTGRTCGCLCQNDDDAEMIGPWLLFSTKFSMADLLTD